MSPVIAEGLQSAGHNAIHVRDYHMQKATDLEVSHVLQKKIEF
ncbi:MAG: hypothetical protein WBQ08_23540 [Candidatus Sulfotelmatobacter sp.]